MEKTTTGFTLIEILIVLTIVGLLALAVIPTYNDTVRQSRRAEVKTALLDHASRITQFFHDRQRYPITWIELGYTNSDLTTGGELPIPSKTDTWYTLQLYTMTTTTKADTLLQNMKLHDDICANNRPCYVLVATVSKTGPQATDVCERIAISSDGTHNGGKGLVGTIKSNSSCW